MTEGEEYVNYGNNVYILYTFTSCQQKDTEDHA